MYKLADAFCECKPVGLVFEVYRHLQAMRTVVFTLRGLQNLQIFIFHVCVSPYVYTYLRIIYTFWLEKKILRWNLLIGIKTNIWFWKKWDIFISNIFFVVFLTTRESDMYTSSYDIIFNRKTQDMNHMIHYSIVSHKTWIISYTIDSYFINDSYFIIYSNASTI